MANRARVPIVRLALAAALCLASGPAPAAGDEPPSSTQGAVAAFMVNLRQTVSESGVRVLDEAAQWLAGLERGERVSGGLRPAIRALTLGPARRNAVASAKIVLPNTAADTAARPAGDRFLEFRAVTLTGGDRGWWFGHAPSNLGAEIGDAALDPATYLSGHLNRGPATGAALAERSLGGHDIELGLPLPPLPELQVTAGGYWWGDRSFMPVVEGYRLGLSYDLDPHLRFEGGRSDDPLHGSAGFLGLRYSVPLDTTRPPGVMPP